MIEFWMLILTSSIYPEHTDHSHTLTYNYRLNQHLQFISVALSYASYRWYVHLSHTDTLSK